MALNWVRGKPSWACRTVSSPRRVLLQCPENKASLSTEMSVSSPLVRLGVSSMTVDKMQPPVLGLSSAVLILTLNITSILTPALF